MTTRNGNQQIPLRFNDSASSHTVTKSKRLALARVDYELTHHRIWNTMISQINPLADYGPMGIQMILTRDEIALLAKIDPSNVPRLARQCATRFLSAQFESKYVGKNGEDEFRMMNLVQYAEYSNGEFLLILTPLASDELTKLSRYGSFDLAYQEKIQSKHSMILIDILSVNWHSKSKGWQSLTMNVDDLRWQFGLKEKKSYQQFNELKRRVIIPAITDINAAGDFFIDDNRTEFIKSGSTVTHVKLIFTRSSIVKSTSAKKGWKERLFEHGLTEAQITEIINESNYSSALYRKDNNYEALITDSINYVESVDQVKSFYHYLVSAIKSGYPYIAAWANPFSDMYKSEKPIVRAFVKSELVKDFWNIEILRSGGKISDDEYSDIVEKGAFSYYYRIRLINFTDKRKGI